MLFIQPFSVVATHKIVKKNAPGQVYYNVGNGGFENVERGMDIYYKTQSRYKKSALKLVMIAITNNLVPMKFEYHRDTRIGTLHCLDMNLRTPDGKGWPTALDLKEVESGE